MSDLIPAQEPTPFDEREAEFQPGQWYWVREKGKKREYDAGVVEDKSTWRWLGCITSVGSNYIEITQPAAEGRGYYEERVHTDDLYDRLRREETPETTIRGLADGHHQTVLKLMDQVSLLVSELGLNPNQIVAPSEGSNALAVVTSAVDVKKYGTALVEAKQKKLPELFKKIETETQEVARWLRAATLPMQAQLANLKNILTGIDDRIFNVELYAGLTEHVAQIAKGKVADISERVRIMQRRLYMDEECLLNYETGGMEFGDIRDFDKWLVKKENRDRILPFPRCVVAMRVRREIKEREAQTLMQSFINFQLGEADKQTFLYLRNGDSVWRLSCEHDFGETLFPEHELVGEGRPMMFKQFGNRINGFMSQAEYDVLCAEEDAYKAKIKAWKKANPGKDYHSHKDNPNYEYHSTDFRRDEWNKLNADHVFYDDAMGEITKQINAYNRFVLILQGLFDRSEVFVPHSRINLGGRDIERHIELIRDAGSTLASGEKPDFEAYRKKLNSMIMPGSYLVGQRKQWRLIEARKATDESARRDRNPVVYKEYEPYGNPGPNLVMVADQWNPRSKIAIFRWERKAARGWPRKMIPCVLRVPAANLFNVSAYTPGDYKQFFLDHRTRTEYLRWAPLMLAAEDFHAGKTTTDREGTIYSRW